MSIYSLLHIIRKIAIIQFILVSASLVFAQQPSLDSAHNYGYVESSNIPENKKNTVIFKESSNLKTSGKAPWQEEKNLSNLQKEARMYREQGLELQRVGDTDAAMSLYQKAIQLDPTYTIAYNDLGVIFEAKGFIDRAEEYYLKSINIDPNYLSAYTNLALLYENKRDLNKAAFYWKKRIELGLAADDPWTEKAKRRLKDINLVLSNTPIEEYIREQEVVELLKDVAGQKTILRTDDKELSKIHFEKAKLNFDKGDYATAIKEALNAQQLNPSNKEIEKFIEKVQTRALSK